MAKKEITKVASNEALAELNQAYPVERGGQSITLPRLGMFSQDKTEETGSGKNKKITVVNAAGEFYIEKQSEETDENGKAVWKKEEIGTEIEGIIFFKRYQLSFYDEGTETYTSSPVYDSKDEVIPLFSDKKEVDRGTSEELKQRYMYTDKSGKEKSKLEEHRILYILYEGKPHQLNLRGSSMYSLLSYERKVQVPTVITRFSSEFMKKGEITWNKMTFSVVRTLTAEEATTIRDLQQESLMAIKLSKESYGQAKTITKDKEDEELDEIAAKF